MIVLAIDSGVEKTGYAFFEKDRKHKEGFKYIASGLIKTSQLKKPEERILDIYDQLSLLLKKHKPNLAVIEQLFFFKNQKTIVSVSQAQGAVLLACAKNKIDALFLTPLQIKQAVTGYGQADKKSVQKMLKILLNLDGELKQDDQADAIACGLAYCYLNK